MIALTFVPLSAHCFCFDALIFYTKQCIKNGTVTQYSEKKTNCTGVR